MLVIEGRLWLIRHKALNRLPNQTSSRYFASFFFVFFSSHHLWSVTYRVMAAIRESANEAVQIRGRNMGYKRKLQHIKDIQAQWELQGFPSGDNEQTNEKWYWRWREKVRKRSQNISTGEEKIFVEWKRDRITNLFHSGKTKIKQYRHFAYIHFRCRSWDQTKSWAKLGQKNFLGVHEVGKLCSTKWADKLMTAWRVKTSDLEWKILRMWGYKCRVLNKIWLIFALLCHRISYWH